MNSTTGVDWNVKELTAEPGLLLPKTFWEAGADAIPVRVRIHQNGTLTGWDDGALGLEEDALWFNGQAMSFWIAQADAYQPTRGFGLSRWTMQLVHPTRRVELELKVLRVDDRNDWEDEAKLHLFLASLPERAAALSGKSQYPPLTVRPGMIRPKTIVTLPKVLFVLAVVTAVGFSISLEMAFFVMLFSCWPVIRELDSIERVRLTKIQEKAEQERNEERNF